MPTYNRRQFVPQAIKYFLEQDYPSKELVIVDDGTDNIKDLIPNDPQIICIQLQRKTSIGAKRNLAIESSNANIILHWDDDDWQARYRISYQVEQLLLNNAEICGNDKLLFYDLQNKQLWRYQYPAQKRKWLAGGSLCYLKSFWQKHKFDDISYGEDTRFVWKRPLENAIIHPDYKYYIAMIHSGNTCPKSLSLGSHEAIIFALYLIVKNFARYTNLVKGHRFWSSSELI